MGSQGARRAFLRGIGVVGGLTIAGRAGAVVTDGTAGTETDDGDCTPGHTKGDPACDQIADDAEVLTGFDATDTPLLVTFDYPCGWRTSTTQQFDDRAQANATRSNVGDEDGYVDIQVRTYYEPVEEGFLDTKAEEGSYVELNYDYGGESRTGIVSGPDTAQYGTLAHAVVPFQDSLVHVELVSTLKGAGCDVTPPPDYGLVREMLASIAPNPGTTFGEASEFFETLPDVSLDEGAGVVQRAPAQTISGTSSLSEGAELTITLRASEPQPLLRTDTTTADGNGDWAVEFDFSDVPAGQAFGIEVTVDGHRVLEGTGSVTQSATIEVSNQQSVDGTTLFADSAHLPEGGFVVVHRAADMEILGHSQPLGSGLYNDIRITLDETLSGGSTDLIFMLHRNSGDASFSQDEDSPYLLDGDPVTDTMTATVQTTTTTTTSTTTTTTTTTTTSTTEATVAPTITTSGATTEETANDGSPGFTSALTTLAVLGAAALAALRGD